MFLRVFLPTHLSNAGWWKSTWKSELSFCSYREWKENRKLCNKVAQSLCFKGRQKAFTKCICSLLGREICAWRCGQGWKAEQLRADTVQLISTVPLRSAAGEAGGNCGHSWWWGALGSKAGGISGIFHSNLKVLLWKPCSGAQHPMHSADSLCASIAVKINITL